MGFIQQIKSRITMENTNDEEQFNRGIREGSWPEGVEDFELMQNTGTYVPDRGQADFGSAQPGFQPLETPGADDWSVVRSAGSMRVDGQAASAGDPSAAGRFQDLPSSYDARYSEDIQVLDRQEGSPERGRTSRSESQKPYAQRLRERVESSDTAPSGAKAPGESYPGRSSVPASAARASGQTDSGHGRKAGTPIKSDALIVRARAYDDVRRIANGLLHERRPVIIVMRGCTDAIVQRVLDVTFGLSCACEASIQELSSKVYAVVPRGRAISDENVEYLRRQGLMS